MFSDNQLRSYLDEALPADQMSAVEQQLRETESLRERLAGLAGMREAGVHALGEIWRRNRMSCPDRQQLGGYLLGTLEDGLQDYIKFHLDSAGCRLCAANLEDLQMQNQEISSVVQSRRRKYFQTSAGYLNKE